ncbi:MAG: DUF4287 domain-containing protein [Bauldia sp.]|nr:DUF4287 domain-containing protein [Bauldia sp.]
MTGELDRARDTQLRNIEKKTGKTLDELRKMIAASGLAKHGQIRGMLQETLGLGHGDANTIAHLALASDGQTAAAAVGASIDDVLAGIYAGSKAALRPVHDAVIAAIAPLGAYETVPKKGYVSLRRKKQFAMVGPATKGQIEVGLNMKDVPPTGRLVAMAPGGMCQYKVRLATVAEVDRDLKGWLKRAFDAAG